MMPDNQSLPQVDDDFTRANEKSRRRKIVQDREVQSKPIAKKGLLMVHTGKGKGKSTAAFGVVARALGHGMRVGVIQFTKGRWRTGERRFFDNHPNITMLSMGDGFTWETQDKEADIAKAQQGWAQAQQFLDQARQTPPLWDIIVLDELNIILRYNYLNIDEIVQTLRQRPQHLHVIVTGRNAKPAMIEAADLVTEMTLIKHPYQAGVRGQKGIEF